MRYLHLELTDRPHPARWIFLWVLSGILLAFIFGAYKLFSIDLQIQHESSLVNAQLDSVEQKRQVQRPVAIQLPESKVRAINESIDRLNFPWEILLTGLEQSKSQDIALLALNPDVNKQRLHVDGEAKSVEEMLNFVEALKRYQYFSDALLLRHEINTQDTNRPYHFTVEIHW